MAETHGKTSVRANRSALNQELLAHCRAKRMNLDAIAQKKAGLYDEAMHKTAGAK